MQQFSLDTQAGNDIHIDATDEIAGSIRRFFVNKLRTSTSKTRYSFRVTLDESLSPTTKEDDPSFQSVDLYPGKKAYLKHGGTKDQCEDLLLDGNIQVELRDGLFDVRYREATAFSEQVICHLIRATVDKLLLSSGYHLYHAGAFVLKGKTVLIVGDKGAGKTTSLVTALDEFNAGYLSNDRVYGKVRDGKFHIIEREAETKIGIETIEGSSLKARLANAVRDTASQKFYFNDLHSVLGAGKVPQGEADVILQPNIKSAADNALETAYDPEVLTSSIITDCIGFNLYKLLLGQVPYEAPDLNGLHLRGMKANGIAGIRKAFQLIA